MLKINGVNSLKHVPDPSVITLGNFDGIHLGHQELIHQCKMLATARQMRSLVMSFYPHPVKVLRPEIKHKRLFPIQDLEEQLQQYEVDILNIEPFNQELANLSAEEFFEEILLKKLNMQALVVGFDFHFGKNKTGDISALTQLCKKHNIELVVVPQQSEKQGLKISSSSIRESLNSGDVHHAWSLLGRPFYNYGEVKKGRQLGRTIGVPTANILDDECIIPKKGVYLTRACLKGGFYPSITNVGVAPTVAEEEILVIETHILTSLGEFYGQLLKVEYLEPLREEKKFNSVEELVKQIHTDIDWAKRRHQEMGL